MNIKQWIEQTLKEAEQPPKQGPQTPLQQDLQRIVDEIDKQRINKR